ncbi:MAG: UDP-glucose/GDP-mannose dehydrogenase family protein [Kiritimatiellae bacterium]|nr:UDP-glucose/GDP-mannose dehydrogenase family protein [Kiritimatiellia bacterium]
MKISIVGTGYVGLVTGACFAEIGHDVLCVDNDDAKIERLKTLDMPIYEEGLEELVTRHVDAGRLRFSISIEEGTHYAQVIFIAVGTPPGSQGQADMSYVERVGREVAQHMSDYRLLVEKSTVPVNTGKQLKRTIEKYSKADIPFDIASNPEFLREGRAIRDALNPDRIVIGVETERAGSILGELYEPIVRRSGCELLVMDIASAELTKHASNSFLAMKISFINAVSRVCELTGADIERVAHGMGLDKRIGPSFLKAGVGYGGSCFPKDVDAFVRIADEVGYDFAILKCVQAINKDQRKRLMQKLQEELWVVAEKTIAILGLAFKPGTDDIREAPSLYFAEKLLEAKAHLRLWDPVANAKFAACYPAPAYFTDPVECVRGADAAVLLTDWPQLKALDLAKVKAAMACPIVIDGRNLFDPADMAARGFTYHCVGR